MVIIDSSVWVAFLNENDSQHSKAKKIFNELKTGIMLPEYVFMEVATILLIKANKKVAAKFIEISEDNSDIEIYLSNGELFLSTIQLFKDSAEEKLSFVDMSLLFLSASYKTITFDKNLQKAIIKQQNAKK
jgi:predicted nucleic acid-binding protein